MLKSFLKFTGNVCLVRVVFFLVFISVQALAQSGKYDLRMVQESVDCVTRKVTFSAQIRASEPGNEFILGSSSILFTNQTPLILSNPVLTSIDHYSGGRYGTLTLSEQSPVITLNVLYAGTAPFTDTLNVISTWTSIAHITFDVASPSNGCYALNWNGANDFPGTDVLEVFISGGVRNEVSATAGTFSNATSCAFADLLPVATISGDTTIQAGQSTTLKVHFTGASPISLTVNGVAYNNLTQSPLSVPVTPAGTTTYTLGSVSNACGAGTGAGSATVTISTPGAISTQNLSSSLVCAGSTVLVPFTTTSTPAPDNLYKVQISDATGANFTDLATTGTTSPLTVTIPAGTAPGAGYRLRVVASNPGIVGSPSAVFSVPAAPTALLSGGATISTGGTANLNVQLTGTAPWKVTLSNSVEYTGSTSPLVISVSPTSTTTFTVGSILDACTSGTASGSAQVIVQPGAGPCATQCAPVSFVIKQN
jgi:hypothetical protein